MLKSLGLSSEAKVYNRYSFLGGTQGLWRVVRMGAFRGPALDTVGRLDIVNRELTALPAGAAWVLQGLTSNARYTTRAEMQALSARQQGLARPEARCAALIPIKKSALWWELPQDERRSIFEETSRHTAIGLEYLPAVARRLHHCRDLNEPFDFLTWFEYAPEHAPVFEELVSRLRATPEWDYVEREIDIRLEHDIHNPQFG